ncbi:MAG TPA: RNA methyltransferase [Candidatus Acidoferrum sp.]|nr:RNA methyltransferase [Candidatus Acidoferrum sp.]
MIGVKEAAELLTSKGRRRQGRFLVEGQKLIDEALAAGYKLCGLWRAEEVGGRAFARLCDTVTPQGVTAAFELPQERELTLVPDGRYMLLENLQNPGNVGSILRTAEAMGLTGVLFCGEAVDIYAPKVLRGSMGSALRMPTLSFDTPDAAKAALAAAGLPLWGSALRADTVKLGGQSLTSGAIAVGNEGAGMSQALLALCDRVVVIPMAGATESLSAPAAAAILLWELFGRNI